jgi:hypothetical protein
MENQNKENSVPSKDEEKSILNENTQTSTESDITLAEKKSSEKDFEQEIKDNNSFENKNPEQEERQEDNDKVTSEEGLSETNNTKPQENNEVLPENDKDNSSNHFTQQYNNSKIGNVFQGGKINVEYKTDFTDPTEKYPKDLFENQTFKITDELQEKINELKEKRIILLSCLDDDVLNRITDTIIQQSEFDDYEKRILRFTGREYENKLDLDIFTKEKIGKGEKLIVVIEINQQNRFLDSLFIHKNSSPKLNQKVTVDNLNNNSTILICRINSKVYKNISEINMSESYFIYWNISFLNYWLHLSLLIKGKEIDRLNKLITKQRECGLWGDKNDNEFYDTLIKYFSRGQEHLLENIKIREDILNNGKINEFINNQKKYKITDLFKKGKEIDKLVLYCATYFSGLTPVDFEKILIILSKDINETIIIESKIQTESGEEKTIKKEKEIESIKFWKEDSDEILEKCNLEIIEENNSTLIIDFSEPYMRKEMKNYLRTKHFFIKKQFDKIRKSGILFDFSISDGLVNNLTSMLAKMTIDNPTQYGENWLFNLIGKLWNYLNIDDIPVNNDIEQFIKIMAKIETEKWKQPFYDRLYRLIREMLNHNQLKDTIAKFCNRLIEIKQNYVLLNLVRQLQFAPNFDFLFWIKQLLDRSNYDIQLKTFHYLTNIVMNNKINIFDVADWLPDSNKESVNYSTSNFCSLIIIINYSDYSISTYDKNLYGEWPSNYSLFPISNQNEEQNQKLKCLMDWIFHPGLKYVKIENRNFSRMNKIAQWTMNWFFILLGFDKENINPSAIEFSELLLKHIVEKVDKSQSNELIEYWKKVLDYYRSEKKKLSFKDTSKRKEINNRIGIGIELKNNFIHLKNKYREKK